MPPTCPTGPAAIHLRERRVTDAGALRRYMAEDSPAHTNARYILALMLERKRMIKEIEVRTAENGQLIRIYEYAKTGEVLIIPDPQLRLSQLAEVQDEVAGMLQ